MPIDLFDYSEYKGFLNDKLDEMDQGGRGARARMSRAIGCQTAYTTQVLRGSSQFNLEQGEAINEFLGHTEEQGHYFLTLLQIAKAGSPKLRDRFQKQRQMALDQRTHLGRRFGVKSILGDREQMIYYSSWHYGAIHALVSIPGFQNPQQIAERLQISSKKAAEAMEFLLDAKILKKDHDGKIVVGQRQIHLASEAPLIAKHHENWRHHAIRAIEKDPTVGLHYSSIISISERDQRLIREKLTEAVREVKSVVRESNEEKLYSFSLDFFEA